jgi:KaiC/GvpD/RAD55 family RecA-like ATPase
VGLDADKGSKVVRYVRNDKYGQEASRDPVQRTEIHNKRPMSWLTPQTAVSNNDLFMKCVLRLIRSLLLIKHRFHSLLERPEP